MAIIGSRQGGVDTQLAVLKFISNSTAPAEDSGADQLYDAGDGVCLIDRDGFSFPLVVGADELGILQMSASDTGDTFDVLTRVVVADTTDGAITGKLPLTAGIRLGHRVLIVDAKRQFATNNFTVDGNGKNINGASTAVLSGQDSVIEFVWGGTTWEMNPAATGSFSSITAETVTASTRVITPQIAPATPGVEITAQGASSSGVPYVLKVTGTADTGQTASTEKISVNFNMNRTVTWATGAITTQREVLFQAPAYAFAAASTITNAATVAISGSPSASTNATITNSMALWVQSGLARFDGPVSLGRATVSQGTNINTDVAINSASGVITTQAATTAAQAAETGFTVTNSAVVAGSVVVARVVTYAGTLMTNGIPDVFVDVVSAGSFHIRVMNIHGTNALNGTMKIHFAVL